MVLFLVILELLGRSFDCGLIVASEKIPMRESSGVFSYYRLPPSKDQLVFTCGRKVALEFRRRMAIFAGVCARAGRNYAPSDDSEQGALNRST